MSVATQPGDAVHNRNPYRDRITNRAKVGLARLGGKHAPSTVASDRSIQAEQYAIDLARETAELAQTVEVYF